MLGAHQTFFLDCVVDAVVHVTTFISWSSNERKMVHGLVSTGRVAVKTVWARNLVRSTALVGCMVELVDWLVMTIDEDGERALGLCCVQAWFARFAHGGEAMVGEGDPWHAVHEILLCAEASRTTATGTQRLAYTPVRSFSDVGHHSLTLAIALLARGFGLLVATLALDVGSVRLAESTTVWAL